MTDGERFAAAILAVDWQDVVLRIRSTGLACATIATRVDSNQQHIARLARGEVKQPRIATAIRLLDLHHDRVLESKR